MTAPVTTFSLCRCRDGQHGDDDHERFYTDRAYAEAGVQFAWPDEMAQTHMLMAFRVVVEVPFVEPDSIRKRADVIEMVQADHAKAGA